MIKGKGKKGKREGKTKRGKDEGGWYGENSGEDGATEMKNDAGTPK